jgi:hypothetical protein
MRTLDRRLAASMLLATGLLSACTAAPGAPTEPTTAASAGPTADPTGDASCYGINESVDTPPRTVAALSKFTDSVVIAEVKAIEGGVWNTKDGAKPEGANGPRFNPGIQTPINLQITATIRGGHGPGAIRVVNPGGTADCVEHIVDNAARVEKGKTYAFFLQPSPDADGVRRPELPLIVVAYPVGPDGSVATEYDGTLSHDDFVALVENPVPPATTPEPSPAGSDNPG